jgi:hypothetical protein
MTSNILSLAGQKFGNWVVKGIDFTKTAQSNSEIYWECRCSCGAGRSVRSSSLRGGLSRSCGCDRGKTLEKHGMSNSKEYEAWRSIKKRCENPNSRSWSAYGGSGIAICEKWSKSFIEFYEDVGPSPSAKHLLIRIDKTIDYAPGNCIWSIQDGESSKTKNTKIIEIDGQAKTIKEWISYFRLDIDPKIVRQRIWHGCNPREAFFRKVVTRKSYVIDGYKRVVDHPCYDVWRQMKRRCQNPSNVNYYLYGGRGISVCERWEVFENFCEDMGQRPEGMTLDRTNTNGNYEPSNCRWASLETQSKNKRTNVWIEHNGETRIIADWARTFAISDTAMSARVKKGFGRIIENYKN